MSSLVSAPLAVLPHVLALVRQAQRLLKAFENRRSVNDLAELSDASLKDIGLSRNDVDAALASPLFEDPTIHLASLSGRRWLAPANARPSAAPRAAPTKTSTAACVG